MDSENKMYYGDYLQLDRILNAQELESRKHGIDAHDEMLFIITHQVYELWFKQIHYELTSVMEIFENPINDNSPEMQIAVHRLERIVTILQLAVQQINIMETMTPLDFLDFRNILRPASGFQSYQFKVLEALLGLKMEERHGREYYISQLKQEHIDKIKTVEQKRSFVELLNDWLERMPFFQRDNFWEDYQPATSVPSDTHIFWQDYRSLYEDSLLKEEKDNINRFDTIFFLGDEKRRLSPEANRAALFIMLYRDYPLLHLPYQLLNVLLDIDEQLATWRYRHMNMVHRMIGTRVGTGGSSGKEYLKAALDKHYIFKELAELTTFLIERNKLPQLPETLTHRLVFAEN